LSDIIKITGTANTNIGILDGGAGYLLWQVMHSPTKSPLACL